MLSVVGLGRERDAVDESIGVAKDDETTAGTEDDLTILARLAANSADGLDLVGVGVDIEAGLLCFFADGTGRDTGIECLGTCEEGESMFGLGEEFNGDFAF